MRFSSFVGLLFLLVAGPLVADTRILGDLSYQPGDPITGLTDIVLDNFTDAVNLGCSVTYAACGGIDILGTLDVTYLDSLGNTQTTLVDVGPTGTGSTPIYEFDPSQITFESAVLTGTISPASFPVADGNTFVTDGTFVSDTLTPDVGFATISVTGTEVTAVPTVPEGAGAGLPEMAIAMFCVLLFCRPFAPTSKR